MIVKWFVGCLLALGMTLPGFCWSLLGQGPVVLTLNAVVLVGLVVFLIYLKNRDKDDE